jgi:hypothetical protein
MPWSRSAVFRAWLECALQPRIGWAPAPTTRWAGGWNLGPGPLNTFNCSLWKDTITPDETAPIELTGFATVGSVWQFFNADTGNGMDSTWAGGKPDNGEAWPIGGRLIPGTGQEGGFSSAGGLITFGGGNPVSNGLCTMALIHGDMVFCLGIAPIGPPTGPVQYQGLAFHYYGGEQRVTDGTFTVVWPPEGVAQLQVI